MLRAIKHSSDKKHDLPIAHGDFKPKKRNLQLERQIKWGVYVFGVLLTFVLTIRWLFTAGVPTQAYSNQESTSFNNYKLSKDSERFNKFDSGVEQYLIDNKGVVQGTPQYKEYEKEVDELYHSSVDYFDLNDFTGDPQGQENGDNILLLIPLRNAEEVLPLMFKHIMNLTYPHSLIDIAFLVSDCSPDDSTLEMTFDYSLALQSGNLTDILIEREKEEARIKGTKDLHLKYMDPDYIERLKKAFDPPFHKDYTTPFRSIQIFKKDFGQVIGQGFSDRHGVKVQGIRRKLMGKARNWLTANALKPYHSWVYWRDVDIEMMPGDIIQDLMKFNYDVIVPNVWRPLPEFLGNEQAYDLNSWVESDQALELAKTLDEDDVIVEGYVEYPTWRVHLGYIRDKNGNPDEIVDLHGIGGVSILAKAKVFRQGVHFPAFTFENHAETEAFGKMARKMGFKVGGLPHYTIWHIYEPSEDDLKEIARKEKLRRRQKKNGD